MSELQTGQQEIFDYIKNNLGEGLIDVELDPHHYQTALERAINRYNSQTGMFDTLLGAQADILGSEGGSKTFAKQANDAEIQALMTQLFELEAAQETDQALSDEEYAQQQAILMQRLQGYTGKNPAVTSLFGNKEQADIVIQGIQNDITNSEAVIKVMGPDGEMIEVVEGEIYGLLGSNGAGKSTTINILLGFLDPDIGEAFINGINANSETHKARKNIGYIPENVNLYPYLTGIENLDYFCKLAGKNYNLEKLKEILIECGLDLIDLDKKVNTYSKGMRQKVGIAIALAKEASVYLLDEPASGLDPLASTELSSILKKLSNGGAAILMASHDIFRVRETCNRIGILKNGVLVKEMDTASVTTKELESIYIEYMKD